MAKNYFKNDKWLSDIWSQLTTLDLWKKISHIQVKIDRIM